VRWQVADGGQAGGCAHPCRDASGRRANEYDDGSAGQASGVRAAPAEGGPEWARAIDTDDHGRGVARPVTGPRRLPAVVRLLAGHEATSGAMGGTARGSRWLTHIGRCFL